MNWYGERKWMIGCIAMAIVLIILTAYNVALYKQNDELKKETISNLNDEWRQLFDLSEKLDEYYIKNNFQEPNKYDLLVNMICFHFTTTGRSNELTLNMRDLLFFAYYPIFGDLSLERGPLNKEEASKLLKDMNDDIMLISKDIIDMQDFEKEKLLEPRSSEFIKINTKVKDIANKYTKLVDDYYKKYLK